MQKHDNTALTWLWRVSGRQKGSILALTVVQALHGASGVVYALLLRGIVDSAAGHDGASFWRYALWTGLLVLAQLALRYAIRFLSELGRSGLENAFKQRLLHALLRKDYNAVSALHSAEWLNRLTNDAVVVANSMVEILPNLAGMCVKLICALVMLTVLDRRFAVILLPLGAALLLLTWLFREVLKRMHKTVQEQDGKLRVFLQERIGAMPILRSFAAEEQTEREASDKMKAHRAARMRKNRFSNICNFGFGAAMSGMYLFGVLWCGYGILQGTISFGTLTAVTQLISQIQSPFASITGYLPRFYAMLASAERLMEIEAFPDECGGEAHSPDEIRDYYGERFDAVELRDAAFTYYPAAESLEELNKDDQPVVLDGLSLTIRRGETLAFTGPSGCGKSTVLKLLMCLYPMDGGERLLRSRDGSAEPLSPAWHRLFAYVPQGNQLLNGTIREIVSFADPSAAQDEERLRRALAVACADGFVSELERGADTQLGERGAGLSEGQMQRLAIARAIFSGSPILLLDEATASLDAETEERLLHNLREMTDMTVVIVTHRPAALTICDRVLQFTENGVVEQKKE